MAPAQAGPRPAHMAHRGVVLEVDSCAVELPRAVVQSLRHIQAARKELLPLTTDLSMAATLAFQIKLREISLNEIQVVRARLRVRIRSSDVIARQTPFRTNARGMPRSRESVRTGLSW